MGQGVRACVLGLAAQMRILPGSATTRTAEWARLQLEGGMKSGMACNAEIVYGSRPDGGMLVGFMKNHRVVAPSCGRAAAESGRLEDFACLPSALAASVP